MTRSIACLLAVLAGCAARAPAPVAPPVMEVRAASAPVAVPPPAPPRVLAVAICDPEPRDRVRLRGCVVDAATGEAAIGATIVAITPTRQHVEITDEHGRYWIPEAVTVDRIEVYFAERHTTVDVRPTAGVVPPIRIDTTTPLPQVIEIEDGVRCCSCVGDTTQGITIDQSYTKTTPAPRR